MSQLPDNLYTAEQTRALDSIASEQYGLSASWLMAKAGEVSLALLSHRWPTAHTLLIVSGTGNNGGDGFEVARQAHAAGYNVTIMQIGSDDKLTPTASAARQAMLDAGLSLTPYHDILPPADIIVDALFGTGIARTVEDPFAQLIDALNQHPAPILSLDIPSGLHADTGSVMGRAICAHTTISFIGLNLGLFTGQGPQMSGKVFFDDLSVPEALYDAIPPKAKQSHLKQFVHFLHPRDKASHKGCYGHVLTVGGDAGMSGAIHLASYAAARTGVGLTTIATHPQHASWLNITRPELMCHGVNHHTDLSPYITAANAIVIGPGLGQSAWAQDLYQFCLTQPQPLIIDADALNLLAQAPQYRTNWILTPHPGEAARLLACSSSDIQRDRVQAVQQLQHQYGGVIVLKGAGTLIFDGTETIHLSPYGNPGMASGGMGDILAGIIGSLVAQGLSLIDAACLGVTLHGLAGDKAAQQDGERGMLAMDLLPHVRHFLNPMR